ncbi:MAG: PilZ domain-containing protein [Thermoanaerobaculia bacterium]
MHRRFSRRVEVRFWRRGEETGHLGFTTNLSKSGLFLGSATALRPGERLRVEILDRTNGFVAEGEVARVHRVSLAMRQVEQPGVGIRFLTPEELIEELVPLARQAGPAVVQGSAGEAPAAPARAGEGADAESPTATADEVEEGGEIDASAPARRTIPVAFDDPSTFLSVFHRDIQSGGLFVSTAEPVELRETVWIELQLPIADQRPKLFEAVVVQRFPATGAVPPGRNVLAGMAVQFLEPERVLADLRPLLDSMRR